jgi:hypothetical protein
LIRSRKVRAIGANPDNHESAEREERDEATKMLSLASDAAWSWRRGELGVVMAAGQEEDDL